MYLKAQELYKKVARNLDLQEEVLDEVLCDDEAIDSVLLAVKQIVAKAVDRATARA